MSYLETLSFTSSEGHFFIFRLSQFDLSILFFTSGEKHFFVFSVNATKFLCSVTFIYFSVLMKKLVKLIVNSHLNELS